MGVEPTGQHALVTSTTPCSVRVAQVRPGDDAGADHAGNDVLAEIVLGCLVGKILVQQEHVGRQAGLSGFWCKLFGIARAEGRLRSLLRGAMKFISSSFLGNFTFLLGALLITTMGAVLYSATSAAREASASARHAQQIVTTLDDLTEQTVRAESDQRGFVLAGTDDFLMARDRDHQKIEQALADLSRLVAADPKQLRTVEKVSALLKARKERYLASEAVRRTSGLEAVVGRLAGAGRRAAEVDALTDALRQDAVSVLERRRAEEQGQQEFAIKVLILASAISVVVLVPAFFGFSAQSRARDRSEKKLRLINERLPGILYQVRRSPEGTFKVTYASGGVSSGRTLPQAAIPDWDSLESMIDERDRPVFRSELARAVSSLQMFRCDYRVQHPGKGDKWLHNEAALERQPDGGI